MAVYYTKTHQWLKVNGESAFFGLTEYGVKQLGEINFIDLPEPGIEFKTDEAIASLESAKAASDIYAPVTGTLVEVNPLLEKDPFMINEDPECGGWIGSIKLFNNEEIKKMMSEELYTAYINDL